MGLCKKIIEHGPFLLKRASQGRLFVYITFLSLSSFYRVRFLISSSPDPNSRYLAADSAQSLEVPSNIQSSIEHFKLSREI